MISLSSDSFLFFIQNLIIYRKYKTKSAYVRSVGIQPFVDCLVYDLFVQSKSKDLVVAQVPGVTELSQLTR